MENWRVTVLHWLNVDTSGFSWIEKLALLMVFLLVIMIIYRVCKLILHRVIFKIVRATKATWDDVIFDHKVLDKAIMIIPALLALVFFPFVFVGEPDIYDLVQRLAGVYVVGVIISTVVTALTALSHILHEKERLRDKPIKGAIQMVQILILLLGVIVMVSIVINKSPAYLLTGLGASAAVLMLVFQDLILGLVAGIQLSANNMMRVGDWVVVKDKDINGTVIEITLTTVKVQNWDYTISTIQPQALVNGSFVNWRNMFDSGGRRIARTINIDLRSVHFLAADDIVRWEKDTLLAEYIADVRERMAEAREKGDEVTVRALRLTNLGLFRVYLQNFISSLSSFNADFVSMVRLMEPTEHGVPMQIYFFTTQTAWVRYEEIQSALFEHVFSIVPEFGLRLFQAPTGEDIRSCLRS